MNKVGIEHWYCHESKESDKGGKNIDDDKENTDLKLGVGADVAEGWYLMRRQLDMLKDENGELRQAMGDLRCEFASKRGSLYREADRNGSVKSDKWVGHADRKSSIDVNVGYPGKGIEGDASEKVKKALKGGASA